MTRGLVTMKCPHTKGGATAPTKTDSNHKQPSRKTGGTMGGEEQEEEMR